MSGEKTQSKHIHNSTVQGGSAHHYLTAFSAVTPRYHGQSSGMRPNVSMVDDLHSPGWSPPTSRPIPVFHERHGPMFPSPGFSPPYQPYMPHSARHEYRRYPNPAYVSGAPLVLWPPRSEPHRHQPNPYAFSGPRQIAFQAPPDSLLWCSSFSQSSDEYI
jgi:hypothetical protein